MGVPDQVADAVALMRSPTAPFAASARAAERAVHEEQDPLRTPYQRDRDRIIHTKAFRRLKHKTQVFIAPEGDHYRTRLTHTLEVSALARTVARALELNEDLVEAITMGHDLGHAPFGHAGEAALHQILSERFGRQFLHNEQSLRVVERVERDGRGLNLTNGVRDGILHHTGADAPATLEGQIVRLVDRVAYVNHDIEDAIRAGLLDADELPADEIALLGDSTTRRLTRLVGDIVETSRGHEVIAQSDEVGEAFRRLRAFMFDRVYLAPPNSVEAERAIHVVTALFDLCLREPERLPESTEPDLVARVTDFVSGMTDRYALRVYREGFLPRDAPI
jgi:dGTPase